MLVFSACSGVRKSAGSRRTDTSSAQGQHLSLKGVTPSVYAPITEVEEKLVAVSDQLPDPHKYFVVIGSFRNPENVKKYQGQISKDGFNAEIIRNEAGLYRVYTMASNDVGTARSEIHRIRMLYPKYSDVWLLIQKK